MIKEAIEKILSLGESKAIEVHDGREFTTQPVHEVVPRRIETLNVHSLQAVVDYLLKDPADAGLKDVAIQVLDPSTVYVLEGQASLSYRLRECYLLAKRIHDEFRFGEYLEQERMVIELMTMFEQTETLKEVLGVVSGLVVSADATVSDDGVSQEVKVRKGVSRVENMTIKNPILLAPIRSFTEIEQVESPYVLRVKERDGMPVVAIFEAGGGAWKNTAVGRIKEWLAKDLPDVKILG